MRALVKTILCLFAVGGVVSGSSGCKKENVAPPRPPVPHGATPNDNGAGTTTQTQLPGPVSPDAPLPPGHPPVPGLNANNDANDAMPSGAVETEMVEGELHLEGVMFELPDGWSRLPNPGGMMAPVAVLRLPKVDGDAEDGEIRITHFPGMKGLNDQNLQRWKMQVKTEDGKEGETTRFEANDVIFTVYDATGAYDAGQAMGSTGPKSGQRFVGIIVDHPKGPHFIKAAGPVKTMTHWRDSIDAFLKSVKIN